MTLSEEIPIFGHGKDIVLIPLCGPDKTICGKK